MQNDLISRSALLEIVQFRLPIDNHNAEVIAGCVDITRWIIENTPAVDAVEVVRCKDCQAYSKNPWSDSGKMVCKYWCGWLPTDPDDFCSYGERREDREQVR